MVHHQHALSNRHVKPRRTWHVEMMSRHFGSLTSKLDCCKTSQVTSDSARNIKLFRDVRGVETATKVKINSSN